MKFYTEISEEERHDWRKMEPTKMALEMLAFIASETEREVLSHLMNGEHTKADLAAGKADGLRKAISLLEHE